MRLTLRNGAILSSPRAGSTSRKARASSTCEHCGKRRIEIGGKILDRFKADRQAQHAVADAELGARLRADAVSASWSPDA